MQERPRISIIVDLVRVQSRMKSSTGRGAFLSQVGWSTALTIEFVRLRHESELEFKKRKLPDKKPPEEEPPSPDLDLSSPVRALMNNPG
jgi:hypothetical protein